MNKFVLGAALALMAIMPASAQKNAKAQKMTPEQAIEMKANRAAKRLMLDDATTAKFAPIYKEYLTELQNCKKDCPKAKACSAGKGQCADMTDADIEKCMEQRMEMQQKKLDIRKTYYKKLKSVLNMKQMQALFCGQQGKKAMPGMQARPAGKKRAAQCAQGRAPHCGQGYAAHCPMQVSEKK